MPAAAPVLAFFSTTELVICLAIALLFFGASKLPGLARSLGQSVNEFKKGMKDDPPSSPADQPPRN